MSLDLNTVMDAVGVRLKTIPGLRVYDYPPDAVAVPAAVVGYPEAVEYDQTYAAGADMAVFVVHVLVGKNSDRASRDGIGAYVSRAGAAAVKTVLEADPTLAGAADTLRVQRAQFGTIDVGGVEYLAASFPVEVYA